MGIDCLSDFVPIYNKLLPSTSSLRHIPLRVYLPSSINTTGPSNSTSASSSPKPPSSNPASPNPENAASAQPPKPAPVHLKVIQALIPPFLPGSRETQTLGTALNAMLPSLFPSRRRTVLAQPVLHGAVVPMAAVAEELMRGAAYADGWVGLNIEMVIS